MKSTPKKIVKYWGHNLCTATLELLLRANASIECPELNDYYLASANLVRLYLCLYTNPTANFKKSIVSSIRDMYIPDLESLPVKWLDKFWIEYNADITMDISEHLSEYRTRDIKINLALFLGLIKNSKYNVINGLLTLYPDTKRFFLNKDIITALTQSRHIGLCIGVFCTLIEKYNLCLDGYVLPLITSRYCGDIIKLLLAHNDTFKKINVSVVLHKLLDISYYGLFKMVIIKAKYDFATNDYGLALNIFASKNLRFIRFMLQHTDDSYLINIMLPNSASIGFLDGSYSRIISHKMYDPDTFISTLLNHNIGRFKVTDFRIIGIYLRPLKNNYLVKLQEAIRYACGVMPVLWNYIRVMNLAPDDFKIDAPEVL